MKQIEKLDFILRALYETSNKTGEVVQLFKEKGIEMSLDDAHRLGRRLADAGYVKFVPTRDSAWVDLKSEGIEFIEGDSFTHKGHSAVTNNYAIFNSPNANIINQSNHVSITQSIDSIKQTIDRLKEEINKEQSISAETRAELIECLGEIEVVTKEGKAPKFAFKALTELASNVASIGSLVIELGKLMGLIHATS